MRVQHRFFPVNGLRLHALDFGGEGRPIVLVHGEGGHGWLWNDVVAPLTLWGRVIAVDLRGHGDSQWSSSGAYGTTELADDLAAVIEQLGDVADVVGLSWGGLAAVRLAARRPELVRHLVVIDAPLRPAVHDATPVADAITAGPVTDATTAGPALPWPNHLDPAQPQAFAHPDAVLAWARRAHRGAPAPLVELIAEHSVRPGPDGTLTSKFDRLFVQSRPFRAERYDADWAAVSAPTLLVRGSDSGVLPASVLDAMVAGRAHVSGLTVEGSGHLVPVERPMELADALEAFLRDDTIGLDDAFDNDAIEALMAYQPVSILSR